MIQLHEIGKRLNDWNALNTTVLAVSSNPPASNAADLKSMGELPFRLLSDQKFENARRFHSYDDFEDIELHSTILIDSQGRVYWARFGGNPFMNMDFLVTQLSRMNELVASEAKNGAPAADEKGSVVPGRK
jgi:peroxiredoxin